MGKMSCFAGLLLLGGKRKASKGKNKGAYAKKVNGNDCPKVKPVEFMDMADALDVSRGGGNDPACNSGFVVRAAAELAGRGGSGDGDKAAIKMGSSDSDADLVAGYTSDGTGESAKRSEPDAGESSSVGRMSPTPPASPKLKRSCSNIETTRSSAPPKGFDLAARSRSYNDLNALPPAWSATPSGAPYASPAASVRTSCSADRVMLKKRSSTLVLPSRSRKLWRRLFLWSHRSLAAPALPSPDAPHQHDGYTLDAVTADAKGKRAAVEVDPIPNQWVAFSAGASPLERVSAWVNSLGDGSFHAVDEEDATEHGGGGALPQCSEIVELPTPGKRQPQAKRRAADEAANQARSIVHALSVFSSVAHISGMGLKAVPAIAAFSTLRAVNLSGNLIVQIAPGSLPKGLHSLDLSRNRIAVIEGLRELTRLRVLNLSYNRISRIGHGKQASMHVLATPFSM
ncbi:hypothetical protein PVAP13_9KG645400 [Panicum virgatum]|uniref:Uncharacterized protein n=1 Tax=Panicum virgatum TaxID=38727 RepID=A0A8T0NXK0_PANVG|nr:hypothetical protein PVAP13_9KG645400 [Panicum virgatum]KAG2554172.1 hypothetical protein PVAP13_9KG645400 [Panicum virgatum]